MNPWRFPILPALCLAGMVGCSGPTLSYASRPGTSVEQFRTISLDPRQDFLPAVENMRRIRNDGIEAQVIREFEGKGYRFVPSMEAELWLDVFTLVPGGARHDRGGEGPGRSGGQGRGSGGGRGHGKGGMERIGASDRQGKGGDSSPSKAGDLMVIVELVERTSAEMVWNAVLELPSGKGSAKGTDPRVALENEVRNLLAPLPVRQSDPSR